MNGKVAPDHFGVLPDERKQIVIRQAYYFDLSPEEWDAWIKEIQSIDGTQDLEFSFVLDEKPITIVVACKSRPLVIEAETLK